MMAYLDNVQARLASLREPHKGVILQSATGEELRRRRTLLPSVLRPSGVAFKGELYRDLAGVAVASFSRYLFRLASHFVAITGDPY